MKNKVEVKYRGRKSLEQQEIDKDLYGEPTHKEIYDRNESIISELLSTGKKVKCIVPVSGGKDSQTC